MKTSRRLQVLSVIAIAFGLLTIMSGGRALFGGAAEQAAVGNAVWFVLWFNFFAGFAYVAAGIGLWQAKRWSAWVAYLLALTTALVAAAFGWNVLSGVAYEMRTVGALVLRLGFWVGVSIVVWRSNKLPD